MRTLRRFPLQRPVTDQNPLTQARQRCAASACATLTRFDKRPAERLIHRVEQHPGLAVGYPHGPRRGRKRAEPVDGLQQFGLSGAEDGIAAELDAYDQLRWVRCFSRRCDEGTEVGVISNIYYLFNAIVSQKV